jgi:HlyD family secretion protein
MKRRVASLSIVVVIALALYFAYRIRRGPSELEWSGTVEAHTIEVGSRVGGRVQEVSALEGDVVEPGQTLVTLEKGDLPAQRTIAEGQLEQMRAALEKVASRTLPTARRAEIAEAQARLQAEQVLQEKAKDDDTRTRRLFNAGAATRVDADNATLAQRAAIAQVSAVRAQMEMLLHGTPDDVRSARGFVEAAEGRLQQIDVMLDELIIRAPRRSRVEALDLRPGDILAPNAPAAKLLEPAELYVRVYVPETEIGRIHPGLELPIFVDSFPGKAFRGHVESVASQGEFTPRNLQTADERADQVFAARVRIEDGAGVLRAGMAAFVRLPR